MGSNLAERQAATTSSSDLKKITVNFAKETYAVLTQLATKQGVTVSEALRRAIKLHAFLLQKLAEGDVVITRKKDGRDVELMLL